MQCKNELRMVFNLLKKIYLRRILGKKAEYKTIQPLYGKNAEILKNIGIFGYKYKPANFVVKTT